MEKISVRPPITDVLIDKQKELLVHYIAIESLPDYPVDLNTRIGQKTIKSFIDKGIEELAESYTELTNMLQYASSNKTKHAMECLENYNLEIADFYHFFLEVLIYSNLDTGDLNIMVQDFIAQNYAQAVTITEGKDAVSALLIIGQWINQEARRKTISPKNDRFIVASEEEAADHTLYAGARRISEQLLDQHAECLWYLTYSLKSIAFQLKNRDWNTTDRETNKVAYYDAICRAFLALMVYMDFAGFGQIPIVNNYLHKAQINLKRIKDGY